MTSTVPLIHHHHRFSTISSLALDALLFPSSCYLLSLGLPSLSLLLYFLSCVALSSFTFFIPPLPSGSFPSPSTLFLLCPFTSCRFLPGCSFSLSLFSFSLILFRFLIDRFFLSFSLRVSLFIWMLPSLLCLHYFLSHYFSVSVFCCLFLTKLYSLFPFCLSSIFLLSLSIKLSAFHTSLSLSLSALTLPNGNISS